MKIRDYAAYGFDDINPFTNYQKEMDRIIGALEGVPRLLLHACCGPCSSYCLEYLSQYFEITVFYYNPNIWPSDEYDLRIAEQKLIIAHTKAVHPIHLVEGAYDTSRYYRAVRGLEDEPEGGRRCHTCYRLRLEEAARVAAALSFDYFTTSLTISPMKDPHVLNAVGRAAGEKYGVRYLNSDFKKKNGYRRSVEIARALDVYRQDYCGCIFSKRSRDAKHYGNDEALGTAGRSGATLAVADHS
ncbi:MAG: epoxyqueuosine reductase QueH [Eubacteriales bacterium]|nr:epoxyqueuosine reductase QueH [Eubacteriales bacterium]